MKWRRLLSIFILLYLHHCPSNDEVKLFKRNPSQEGDDDLHEFYALSTISEKRDESFPAVPEYNDPLFKWQWYLNNAKQPDHDLNVLPVWAAGITGKGVVVSLIDDGIDFEHADLRDNFRADLSFDFNRNRSLGLPDAKLKDHHGTRCAGQIVGKHNNGICGVGIAPDAQISAIRILSMSVASKNEAAAVVHRYHENHIYSCSWGPADDGKAIDAPDSNVLSSFIDGVVNGRSGLGSIYVFAAGNGKSVDNCNYDGYANGIFALTVGAIDGNHKMPNYMEPCSAQIISAYSSNSTHKIPTTDLGGNKCTLKHGGTSAAAPMVAAIIALALSVRLDLTWRDVRYLCVETAVPVNIKDHSWVKNGAGRFYSYKFGFGKIDAHSLVNAAKGWRRVNNMAVRSLPTKHVSKEISLKNPCMDTLDISDYIMKSSGLSDIKTLEQVTVKLNIKHSFRGDLEIDLQSPQGTIIKLATKRPNDDSKEGLIGWTMMTVGFWGEGIKGNWTLTVSNAPKTKSRGILVDYRISFWGAVEDNSVEDNVKFADLFHHDYYPPNATFYDDKLGYWNNNFSANREENFNAEDASDYYYFAKLFGIICLIIIALLVLMVFLLRSLIAKGRRRRFNRRGSPLIVSSSIPHPLDNDAINMTSMPMDRLLPPSPFN